MTNSNMKLYFYSLLYIYVLWNSSAHGNEISFLKHCLNESNPSSFPSSGEQSSGSLVMRSDSPGSEPWYLPNLNCSISLTTESNFHILLTFSNVSLRNSSMDNLTVIFNNDGSDAVLAGQQVCSSENCEGLKFDSGNFNNVTLKFVSANVTVPKNVTGFQGHYTVFNYVDDSTGACEGKQRFLCDNKHCIWYGLVCDGHNNCGDNSDESKCVIPVKDTVWGIIIIVAAIILIFIFVPTFCYLATYGTRSFVKSVLIPNQPTPLSNAVDCGETSGLLTSSEAVTNNWPGTSYDRRNSFSYGVAQNSGTTVSPHIKKKLESGSEGGSGML
ncbi:hypothetical protein JTE90_009324 [Oedothorax gibbosus]|uniref:CUB domain-containing protein n=1 Tax=Oedothorax gibbosus TaxID=931172 RepID=A0AAV6VTT9_9ARAC|nr:hypothetical protein JTE90_009324 [Oedothorax gibbosus]